MTFKQILFLVKHKLWVSAVLTFTAGFGLVPRSIFGAAQNVSSRWIHQVTGVAAVGHRVVEGELTAQVDPIGHGPRVSTADH